MRRLLAIILLAFLPLQFSWAAVASYCAHETAADAGHVGHHEHEHQGATEVEAEPGLAADKVPGAPDLDCGQCHGHHAGLPLGAGEVPDGSSNVTLARLADEAMGVQLHSRPERPQWAPLA